MLLCGMVRGQIKVLLFNIFTIQVYIITSQALYLKYSTCDITTSALSKVVKCSIICIQYTHKKMQTHSSL